VDVRRFYLFLLVRCVQPDGGTYHLLILEEEEERKKKEEERKKKEEEERKKKGEEERGKGVSEETPGTTDNTIGVNELDATIDGACYTLHEHLLVMVLNLNVETCFSPSYSWFHRNKAITNSFILH